MKTDNCQTIERKSLYALFKALAQRGYTIVGPTVRDQAIIYDELASPDDLPAGWTDEQDGGSYRLKKRSDAALFGYTVGPHSWKKFLFPPEKCLWKANTDGSDFNIVPEIEPPPRYAFIGVRACELYAIAIQDKVFIQGTHKDPVYDGRRKGLFIVAVNCAQAGGTCFCVSMQTGPKADSGFDLALTEIVSADRHYFMIEAGSAQGEEILAEIPHKPALDSEKTAAHMAVSRAAMQMGRHLNTTNIKDLLYKNTDHPRWNDVAVRCLSCANCTMVCPTCFCSTVEDVTDITGNHAERWQKWDSCFTMDFSYLHGGSVRATTKSRYRQWMTHKLAAWQDQFGTSGCVGCGRCISWCPVGIDITEEARIMRENPADARKFTKE